MKIENLSQPIEVNGAFITPEMVEQIKQLQDNDNDYLNTVSLNMSQAVCNFVIKSDGDPDFYLKIQSDILSIAYARDMLLMFKR